MAATDHDDGTVPDLYRLLGVRQGASGQELALAWRRRARDEHPDVRPSDANAPGRFRALAEAWRVLGDPARRAAYDRSLAHGEPAVFPLPGATSRIPVQHLRGRESGQPQAGAAEPPLRAGPVRVQRPRPAPAAAAGWAVEQVTLAVAAERVSRYLGPRW
jgi:curved DNA-binding protein CbpA